jgi:hypothetical protein
MARRLFQRYQSRRKRLQRVPRRRQQQRSVLQSVHSHPSFPQHCAESRLLLPLKLLHNSQLLRALVLETVKLDLPKIPMMAPSFMISTLTTFEIGICSPKGQLNNKCEISFVPAQHELNGYSSQIHEETGASVTTKGVWYPDRSKANDKDSPLYLHISASSQEILDKAIEKVNELIAIDMGSLVEDRSKDKPRERVGCLRTQSLLTFLMPFVYSENGPRKRLKSDLKVFGTSTFERK